MTALTVTAKGQLTLRKEILQHLGIRAGEKVQVHTLPGGKVEIRALDRAGSVRDVYGLLQGKSTTRATLQQIDEAAAAGWAGARD